MRCSPLGYHMMHQCMCPDSNSVRRLDSGGCQHILLLTSQPTALTIFNNINTVLFFFVEKMTFVGLEPATSVPQHPSTPPTYHLVLSCDFTNIYIYIYIYIYFKVGYTKSYRNLNLVKYIRLNY